MNKLDALDQLGPIADEMLAGLHADSTMKMRIRAAAMKPAPVRVMPRGAIPALCCAALAIVITGTAHMGRLAPAQSGQRTAQIATIAAGDGDALVMGDMMLADLGDNAQVRAAAPKHSSLFASGEGDIPLVAVNGAVYRMLTSPKALSDALTGDALGEIAVHTAEPSLAGGEEMAAGLSNVAAQGAGVYAVSGVSSQTAVAAEVGGQMRVFQRVSYAGRGPGGQGLEDTFDVRGQVKELTLSGVGTLEGEAANAAIDVLLDNATLESADASARKQSLTVTLDSGLKFQLGVSGDTLCGCGGWSCPEFFEAFEAAL